MAKSLLRTGVHMRHPPGLSRAGRPHGAAITASSPEEGCLVWLSPGDVNERTPTTTRDRRRRAARRRAIQLHVSGPGARLRNRPRRLDAVAHLAQGARDHEIFL